MPRKSTATRTTRTAKKIELLQNLINHPRTGAEERDAAQRMLQRVVAKARENGEQIADAQTGRNQSGYQLPEVVYGDKYEQVKGMRLQDIAKLMRADIKIARKVGTKSFAPGAVAVVDPIGDMPKQIKVSVTSEYFSGGGAIRMRVKNVPREWGFVKKPNLWGEMRWMPSAAFEAVLTDLKVIHQAYNYDGSDSQVDYYHVNFYGQVDYDRPADLNDETPEAPVSTPAQSHTAPPAPETAPPQPLEPFTQAQIEAAAQAAGMHNVRPVHQDGVLIGYSAQHSGGFYGALVPTGKVLRLNHRSRTTVAMWLERNQPRTTPATDANAHQPAPPIKQPQATSHLTFAHAEGDRHAHAADIKAASADEPEHARYAARLIAHYETGGTLANEPDHEDLMGVSIRMGAALSSDIQAIYRVTPEAQAAGNQYPYRADYRRVRKEEHIRRSRKRGVHEQHETTPPSTAATQQ
ncbi:hypothetical protein AB0N09_05255 [Streptomyces erythrochromogenes]|uniref:hypothetical protein n=1 Tax=Streptomyces erythrochromogenes TaxID=285574 RepID=UPI00343C6117